MKLLLVPLMGPFHLRYPMYNSVTVRDAVAAFKPQALAITALEPGALETPRWQDTPEVALPLSVLPWAEARKIAVYTLGEASPDARAQGDFRRYAQEYPQLGQHLSDVETLLNPVHDLLAEPLTLERIFKEVLPPLKHYQQQREAVFEDGPASDWLKDRMTRVAKRVLALPYTRLALLASLDHLPYLEIALEGPELIKPDSPEPSQESRTRSLLDLAFSLSVPEPGNLLAQLRTLPQAEARYHEANLLMVNAHLAEALEKLEQARAGDFSEPYFLPGYLLARLGQVYDLTGQRDAALRSYRGVRALSYAPLEALELAKEGLERPLLWPEQDQDAQG